MGVEVKSGGEGVIVADRGCNDGCCCNGRNSGWGSQNNHSSGILINSRTLQREGVHLTGCTPFFVLTPKNLERWKKKN